MVGLSEHFGCAHSCHPKERLSRLKKSHADIDVRAQVITASIYSVAFHGAELFPLGQQHTKSLRYHVAEALVGPSESMSSVLVTLCYAVCLKVFARPGTPTNPKCLRCRSSIPVAAASIHPAGFLSISSCPIFPRPNTSKGPASTLKAYFSRLGWTFDDQGMSQASTFVKSHFLTCPWHTLTHFAEHAWQDKLLLQHTHRRALMHFPNIDQHLTRSVLAKFTSRERRLLIREIAGAFQTRSQQAVWDDQVTPDCPWCGKEDAKHHRYFTCTATQTQPSRDGFPSLVSTLLEVDTLLPDLPVIFEAAQKEFRFTFQFALQERPFLPTIPCMSMPMGAVSAPPYPLFALLGIVWSLTLVAVMLNAFGTPRDLRKQGNHLRPSMLSSKNFAHVSRTSIMLNYWPLSELRKAIVMQSFMQIRLVLLLPSKGRLRSQVKLYTGTPVLLCANA